MTGPVVIELDARRRCSLAKVGRKEDRLYIAAELDGGVILLTPAKVVPITGRS